MKPFKLVFIKDNSCGSGSPQAKGCV